MNHQKIFITLFTLSIISGCTTRIKEPTHTKSDIDTYTQTSINQNTIIIDSDCPPSEAISSAVETGDVEMVKKLIRDGVDINRQILDTRFKSIYELNPGLQFHENILNVTACDVILNIACRNNEYEVVKVLLEAGANLNISNRFGEFPLYHAVKNKNIEIINLLLENQANVNYTAEPLDSLIVFSQPTDGLRVQLPCTTCDGHYAILEAIDTNNVEIVQLLLKAGADLNIKLFSKGLRGAHNTPLKLARRKNNPEIIKLIEEYIK